MNLNNNTHIMEPTKEQYTALRKKESHPIRLMYSIWNLKSRTKLSLMEFERYFGIWLAMSSISNSLIEGCSIKMKYFDSKFAYMR